jgi:hypothetical protein
LLETFLLLVAVGEDHCPVECIDWRKEDYPLPLDALARDLLAVGLL